MKPAAYRLRIALVLALFLCFTMAMLIARAQSGYYLVSGAILGLPTTPGTFLNIYDNGTLEGQWPSNGVFDFQIPGSGTVSYNVTIGPPNGETCSVTNPTGQLTQKASVVNNVWVWCTSPNSTPPPSPWQALKNSPPGPTGLMILLSDGTVLVADYNAVTQWFKLSPDSYGRYVDGTWSTVANSNCPHNLFASQVLNDQDARVFVAGGEYPKTPAGLPGCAQPGEYGTGVDTELYDPVANTWTKADPPSNLIDPSKTAAPNPVSGTQAFADMVSEALPDGSVLMAPDAPMNCGDTLIFNPSTFNPNTPGSGWSGAGKLADSGNPPTPPPYSCDQAEATWVKLQDGSILTADPPVSPGGIQTSERYILGQHGWFSDAPLGFCLFDTYYGYGDGEEGPAFLLPSGQAIFIGGATVSGTFTPATPSSHDTWAEATIAPASAITGGLPLAADDAPGAMMATGKILLALNFGATPFDVTPSPVLFFEYDPVQQSYLEVPAPPDSVSATLGPWADCSSTTMLDLPDGTVLTRAGCSNQLFVYHPSGVALQQGRPTITTVTANPVGSYHLVGTGLTGISEGASYGDDAQMATDYPLVRLIGSYGKVQYARTYNWTSTSMMPGASGSVDFDIPALAPGAYSLQVVVNGNASGSVAFSIAQPTSDCGRLVQSIAQAYVNNVKLTTAQQQQFSLSLQMCLQSKQISHTTYNSATQQLRPQGLPSPSPTRIPPPS
jgi:hypothetical protein